MNHTVRIGRRDADDPANDLYGIEFEEADDDGKILVSGGIQPVCPDCGHGHLQWAEAGYVPYHRICDVCGSHWDLHPMKYIQWGDDHPWTGTSGVTGCIVDVADMDPDPRLPDGITHAELLRAALEHGTEPNGREDQRIASACWARRARFYG